MTVTVGLICRLLGCNPTPTLPGRPITGAPCVRCRKATT